MDLCHLLTLASRFVNVFEVLISAFRPRFPMSHSVVLFKFGALTKREGCTCKRYMFVYPSTGSFRAKEKFGATGLW